jgi:hypothetical protein
MVIDRIIRNGSHNIPGVSLGMNRCNRDGSFNRSSELAKGPAGINIEKYFVYTLKGTPHRVFFSCCRCPRAGVSQDRYGIQKYYPIEDRYPPVHENEPAGTKDNK